MEMWVENNGTETLRAAGNPGTVSFKLKRINTLVNKQRTEIKEKQANVFTQWQSAGAIDSQEYRDLIRHPDPFGEIDQILDQNVPADAAPQPDETIRIDEEENEDE